MERIGLAASKIAKGNLFLYNLFVVLISFLFSLFVFFMAGAAIILALLVINRIVSGIIPSSFGQGWTIVMLVCMISLAVTVAVFNLLAILRNIRLPKAK
jgi:hypothetical protein